MTSQHPRSIPSFVFSKLCKKVFTISKMTYFFIKIYHKIQFSFRRHTKITNFVLLPSQNKLRRVHFGAV